MTTITLTFAAVLTVLHCSADQLPPPTNLKCNLPDQISVNLTWSWQRPSNLPENCKIYYVISYPEGPQRTNAKYFEHRCPMNVHNYTVKAVGVESCNGWTPSTPVPIINQMLQDKVVKDFRCVPRSSGMNCSWIPKDRSLDLTFSYCDCSSNSKVCKPVKDCDLYTSGIRNGCLMKEISPNELEIGFLVKSTNGLDVIKPVFVLPSPKLKVTAIRDLLILSWTPPNVGPWDCPWEYELCFTECGRKQSCRNITSMSRNMSYDENCMYTFRSRVFPSRLYCRLLSSNFSEDVKYGMTKPPDTTLTMIAIVIPIILFICVILSCYCFWKHSDIICANPPDPSTILKEMMSGNKEHENKREGLYTPLPEDVEPCIISPITENRRLQENP
uniref:interleukin-13 receptor subunit alpha-1-like n=1 Tax=Solea senegalensis TaxID=28829 RepID=UPI001CD90E4C|nr:interleukin-13 receptor subunit alpha-1-like [Solea senegalensis]